MVKRFWIIALFFALPCYGQDNQVFAPFVTQLEAEIRNNLIRLSWKDSLDSKGPVYVYRSETPFSGLASLPLPAEVPYGTESYLDEAETPGELYYYVVASDEQGRKYTLSILYTNTVNITIAPENVGLFGPAASPSAPRPVLPGIENISARVEGDRVLISFSGLDSARNPILYRSINPIRRPEDLLSALIIRQRVGSPYVDRPLAGIPFYYAILYEDELSTGLLNLRPGSNVTAAVEIPATRQTGSRDIPLPGIALSPGQEVEPGALGPEAARTEAAIQQRGERGGAAPQTMIFPEDLEPGGSGEEYQLRSIVQDYFSLKNWEQAQEELRRFLELPRGKTSRAKANFYLGQVYYFQDKQREALLSFLEAQDVYPQETNYWIQIVLGNLSKNR